MTLSRWKLLAGVFGLSVCGLAALAEPACRTAGHGSPRQLPPVAESKPELKPLPGGTPLPPPIEVGAPKPSEVKPAPAPAPLPAIPPAAPKPLDPLPPAPKPVLGEPVELGLPMLKDDKTKPETLPALPLPGSPTPNIPGATAVPDPGPVALPGLPGLPPVQPASKEPVPPLPLPGVAGGAGAVPPLPQPGSASEEKPQPGSAAPLPLPGSPLQRPVTDVKPLPLPAPGEATLPQPGLPRDPKPLHIPPVTPPAEVRPVEARAATPTVEKRLKVTLQMGEGNPRFEIRDGEEVVLKVVSDKVDVKAPTEKGDLWSVLKASGRVKFQSPGGDGYCDELQIIPGTCEVIATGKVQFKYNWGKVETAVTSERMTFRLGATPNGQ